jgi:TonB family protein
MARLIRTASGGEKLTRRLQWAAVLAALGAALVSLLAHPVFAQQPEIDAVAKKLAKSLSKAHTTKVVVFDFTGPRRGVTQMGVTLVDQLSAALTSDGHGYVVVSRAEWMQALENQNLESGNPWRFATPGVARWIGAELGVSAVVVGTLADDPAGGFRLTLDSYQVSREKRIGELAVTIRATPELSRLTSGIRTPSMKVPEAGNNGYSIARCASCPTPCMPAEASRQKRSGTVVLSVVITPEGEARDFRILTDPGYGMAKMAIQAVSKWRFVPATGPEGKPSAVHMVEETTFGEHP